MTLIGMIHLLPLPGSPLYGGSIKSIIDRAMNDAHILIDAGFDGLLIENFGDAPFFKERNPAHTITSMTVAANEIRKSFDRMLGVQALRNDAISALAIAHAVGAQFIRVNVLSGAMITDQGIVESNAAEVLRYRTQIAPDVKIWADVHVKHSYPLVNQQIEEAAVELVGRALADAVIVSGSGTGKETSLEDVMKVKSVVNVPIIIGSGVNEENAKKYFSYADALIVGTSIKSDWMTSTKGIDTQNPVDSIKAKRFVEAVRKLSVKNGNP